MRYHSTRFLGCAALAAAMFGGAVTSAAGQTVFRPSLSPWEGFYLGVHGGYGWGDNDVLEDPTNPVPYNGAGNGWSYDTDGYLAGVHAGLNWESYRLLMGLEATFGYMSIEGNGPDRASPGHALLYEGRRGIRRPGLVGRRCLHGGTLQSDDDQRRQ